MEDIPWAVQYSSEMLGETLSEAVSETENVEGSAHHTIFAPATSVKTYYHRLLGYLRNDAIYYRLGINVIDRQTGHQFFESMPIYVRLGMHLLYVGSMEEHILQSRRVERLLEEESIREGRIFDSPKSVSHIPSFINIYHIPLDELLEPDPSKYLNFNQFFARKLKPGARKVADGALVVSCADCRLVVYETVSLAKQLWIKGHKFTIPNLIGKSADDLTGSVYNNCALGVFRLAPQDYHRFHCPVECTVGAVTDIPGEYYTVNPLAINEDLNVFTSNRRAVIELFVDDSPQPVLFVAVGAMLVGSIVWTVKKGDKLKRGDELGYFQYGGSTCIVIFPTTFPVRFDQDLILHSQQSVETLVRVGSRIAT